MMCLKNGESIAKVILFHLCKIGFIRKTRQKSSIFTFKVLDRRRFGGRSSTLSYGMDVVLTSFWRSFCRDVLVKRCGEVL